MDLRDEVNLWKAGVRIGELLLEVGRDRTTRGLVMRGINGPAAPGPVCQLVGDSSVHIALPNPLVISFSSTSRPELRPGIES